ncbi:hypothetical protein LguiA_015540 [Lonicera macranthoides]
MSGRKSTFILPTAILSTLLLFHLIPVATSQNRHVPASDGPKITQFLLSIPAIFSQQNHHVIPSDKSKLDEWIARNIKQYRQRKVKAGVALDPQLAAAEENVRIIKVRQDGAGDFKTITDAVNSVPEGNKNRTVIWIGGGEYWEKIKVNVTKRFLTFYGSANDMPRLMYNGTALEYGTFDSATVAVESDYFMAANIVFVNIAPKPDGIGTGEQAVAMRISGDKASFYNCKFLGFQDTLCDDRGMHFFKDCHIQGTVDFIFGNGKSVYLNTTIQSVTDNVGVITAHARVNASDESGFTFVHCNINGTGRNELGRAWKERPRVIFAYTYMGPIITPQGWSDYNKPERQRTVYYGEYNCTGPGAAPYGRVKYAKILSYGEARPFLSMTYIHGREWLLPPPNL